MNALNNFVNMGGKVTRQVGQYVFGVDGGGGNHEVLAFMASTGELIKAKNINELQMSKIKTVDDIYDFMYGEPTAPDFTKVLNKVK